MSVCTRSTSRRFRSGGLTAMSERFCRCLKKRINLERVQGKGTKVPLPLHPIPSPKQNKKCQACARSKMSTLSPTGYSAAPTGLGEVRGDYPTLTRADGKSQVQAAVLWV